MPKFKFAALAILELLTFNAQKIKGHVTLTTPPFRDFFQGSRRDFTWDHARQILS